jgi:hypothetical protein
MKNLFFPKQETFLSMKTASRPVRETFRMMKKTSQQYRETFRACGNLLDSVRGLSARAETFSNELEDFPGISTLSDLQLRQVITSPF